MLGYGDEVSQQQIEAELEALIELESPTIDEDEEVVLTLEDLEEIF